MFLPKVEKNESDDASDILHPSPFFNKHKDTIIWVRDVAVIVLYVLLVAIVFLTTWIKAQSAEFPFNVNAVAKGIYFGDTTIRPLLVFICVFTAFLFSVALRMIFMGVVENSIGSRFENHMQTHGHLRKIKVDKDK